MYTKLKDFQQLRANRGWSLYTPRIGKCLTFSRPLYFARVDIKSCFDTINQDKLLDIIYRVIRSNEYMLHRYCEVNMDQGKVRKRFNVRATATGT
jgi:hypothetical protein